MASILRQIVAGPRAKHAEAGLDLCYVTDNIIATSGPSHTYPQRAYRNPLDQLVAFLDQKHGKDWAIWEFRAEGTGYPDHLVYGRIRHYPFPDHHPPPFRLMPMIIASMRDWLDGEDFDFGPHAGSNPRPANGADVDPAERERRRKNRVVVVHCKAGKGRSGTASCSYLIAEEGWTAEDALARFTERRMRPKFGAGVSIPSQLRWVSYVERWTHHGKKYTDRPVEIVEIHLWGLRNGVKVDVEGYVDEGKKIQAFHTFTRNERTITEEGAPEGGGFSDMVWELAGYSTNPTYVAPPEAENSEAANLEKRGSDRQHPLPPYKNGTNLMKEKGANLMNRLSTSGSPRSSSKNRSDKTHLGERSSQSPHRPSSFRIEPSEGSEPGGMAVILRAKKPIRVPTNDVNIAVELRNRSAKNMGWTMVSGVAHVWFNAFFEGQGPEQDGRANASGVFNINWDAMDGIKGLSQKGARALDNMSVVWRTVADEVQDMGEDVSEPALGKPVPQMKAADWQGAHEEPAQADLGLREESRPTSADVSKASSVKSMDVGEGGPSKEDKAGEDDEAEFEGLKSSGPEGEELAGDSGGQAKGDASDETKG